MIKHYYPDEVSAEEFIKILKADSKMFLENMKVVKDGQGTKYVEQWVEAFFLWMEMKRP